MQIFHSSMGAGDNVAHIAHIGGTLFGLTVCMFMLSVHLLPRDQFDVLALLQRWNKRRQYQDLVRRDMTHLPMFPPSASSRIRIWIIFRI